MVTSIIDDVITLSYLSAGDNRQWVWPWITRSNVQMETIWYLLRLLCTKYFVALIQSNAHDGWQRYQLDGSRVNFNLCKNHSYWVFLRQCDVITCICFRPFVKGIHRSPVDSPYKGPVMRPFDVPLDVSLNQLLDTLSMGWWSDTMQRSYDVTVMGVIP